jgi:predicted nucleotidyltransferase
MGMEDTLGHLRRIEEARRQAGLQRATALRQNLAEAAALLRSAGASRVVLFGSLVVGEPHAGSDVDLAAEGLPRTRLFELQAELMELFGTHVDLVLLEDAPESLRSSIAAEGEEL